MSVTITAPKSYQVFQRDASDLGDVVIAGTYVGVTGAPQARFNGGAWTTLTDYTAAGGNFSGTLVDQPVGQGSLEVRFTNNTGDVSPAVTFVGVGDIFVVAGQSNASGRAKALQAYDPGASAIRAGNYKNSNLWAQLADPFDDPTGQVDAVSKDTADPAHMGSWVQRVTTHYIETVNGVPIGWIPCPMGGTSISQWLRVIDSTYLYGSMWKRINQGAHGKIKAVLWFQGESDSSTPMDTYAAKLSQFATDVFNDFGVPTIAALIGTYPPGGSTNYRLGPRGGALKAINENEHLLMGPAFYDKDYDDAGPHYTTNANITMVGDRFWGAVKEHFYGGDGSGIGPASFVANYDSVENIINLDFDVDIDTLDLFTADSGTFHVVDSTGAAVATGDPCRSGDRTVRIPLSTVPLGDPANMTVTYGLDNLPEGSVYGLGGFPAVPAYLFPVSGNPVSFS